MAIASSQLCTPKGVKYTVSKVSFGDNQVIIISPFPTKKPYKILRGVLKKITTILSSGHAISVEQKMVESHVEAYSNVENTGIQALQGVPHLETQVGLD